MTCCIHMSCGCGGSCGGGCGGGWGGGCRPAHQCACTCPKPEEKKKEEEKKPPEFPWRGVIILAALLVVIACVGTAGQGGASIRDYDCVDDCRGPWVWPTPSRPVHKTPRPQRSSYQQQSGARSSGAEIGHPYEVDGRMYVPSLDPNYEERGYASVNSSALSGARTANGEIYDENAVTAAHRTLPLPSYVMVTNLENNRQLLVRVNDRGPFKGDQIISLSRRAAAELGFDETGMARVSVRYAGAAPTASGEVAYWALDGHERPAGDGAARGGGAARRPQAVDPYDTGPFRPIPPRIPGRAEPRAGARAGAGGPGAGGGGAGGGAPGGGGQGPGGGPGAGGPGAGSPGAGEPGADGGPRGGAGPRADVAPEPGVADAGETGGALYVQAAAYGDPDRASQASELLAELGETSVTPVQTPQGERHRVRVGPLRDEQDAQATRSAAMRLGFPDAQVIRAN